MKAIMAIAASLMIPRDLLREVNEVEREQRRLTEMLPEECNIEWMKICGGIAQGSTTQKTADVIHRLSTNLMLGLPIEEAISATKEQVQEEDDFYRQYGFKRGMI